MISIIVATTEDRVIGKSGGIPWKISEDMKLFKERTTGSVVIMGRKTWASLPQKSRPLPNRINVVISNRYLLNPHELISEIEVPENIRNVRVCSSIAEAVEIAKTYEREIFIIGGEQVYRSALEANIVDRIFVSLVENKYDGDVYFPVLDANWILQNTEEHKGFKLLEYVK